MEKITLSFFVPCFNEENNIIKTLNDIKDGAKHINYEVLVADDASKDKTVEMVEKFKIDNPKEDVKIFSNMTTLFGLSNNIHLQAMKKRNMSL